MNYEIVYLAISGIQVVIDLKTKADYECKSYYSYGQEEYLFNEDNIMVEYVDAPVNCKVKFRTT